MAGAEKSASAQGRPRVVQGRKQMLGITDQGLIRQAKMAMLENDAKISYAAEEAAREWLEHRKSRKAATRRRGAV